MKWIKTVYNLYGRRVWSCAHINVNKFSSHQVSHPLLQTSKVASLAPMQTYSARINVESILGKVKLAKYQNHMLGGNESPVSYEPNIQLRIRSKKRDFFHRDVYKSSCFAALGGREWEDLPDTLIPSGGSEDNLETGKLGLAKPGPKLEVAISALQSLTARLGNLNLSKISESALWELLSELLQYRYIPSKKVLSDLRRYCHGKFPEWDEDTILKVLDWWHLIGSLDNQTFSLAMKHLSSRSELKAHQLVLVLYFVSIYKEVPSDVASSLVRQIEQSSQNLDWSELSIVCEGFLKCRPRIESKSLALEVLNRIQTFSTKPDSVYQLVTVLRFLSRSYERDYDTLQKIAAVMTPIVQSSDFIVVPHIAAAFAKLRCYHHGMFAAVTERTMVSLSDETTKQNLRPKDIWLLLWAYGRLNYLPTEGFIDTLIDQLRRGERASLRYPLNQVKSLIALCFLDVYPLELIERTFDGVFLKACEDLNFPDVYKQLVILDNSVAIDRPEYCGHRLPKEFRERSLQVPHGTAGYTLELRKETRSLVETIARAAGGKEFLKTTPILPHIRTPGDIEVDPSREALHNISVDEHRLMMPQPLPPGSQRLAVIYQLKTNYRFSPRKLLGVHLMKKRQLQRLGYNVIEVPYFEWQPLTHLSEKKRMRYIEKKMSEVIGKDTEG